MILHSGSKHKNPRIYNESLFLRPSISKEQEAELLRVSKDKVQLLTFNLLENSLKLTINKTLPFNGHLWMKPLMTICCLPLWFHSNNITQVFTNGTHDKLLCIPKTNRTVYKQHIFVLLVWNNLRVMSWQIKVKTTIQINAERNFHLCYLLYNPYWASGCSVMFIKLEIPSSACLLKSLPARETNKIQQHSYRSVLFIKKNVFPFFGTYYMGFKAYFMLSSHSLILFLPLIFFYQRYT